MDVGRTDRRPTCSWVRIRFDCGSTQSPRMAEPRDVAGLIEHNASYEHETSIREPETAALKGAYTFESCALRWI